MKKTIIGILVLFVFIGMTLLPAFSAQENKIGAEIELKPSDMRYVFFGIVTGEKWIEEIDEVQYTFVKPVFVIVRPSISKTRFLFGGVELGLRDSSVSLRFGRILIEDSTLPIIRQAS